MVDTLASGASGGNPVEVQVLSSAPVSFETKSHKYRVLFLCTGNSCRSQMAEGWARHLHGSVFDAYSAGTQKTVINNHAVTMMAEAGVDISYHYSKIINDLRDFRFDFVFTVCDHAAQACPVFPGLTVIEHHPFDDPPALAKTANTEHDRQKHYRRVRDEIRAWVNDLPASLQLNTA